MRCRARVLFDGQGIVVKLGAKNDLEKLGPNLEGITKFAWICERRVVTDWDFIGFITIKQTIWENMFFVFSFCIVSMQIQFG